MLLTGFCRDNFSGGFLVESIFGVDGRADSVDTDAGAVARVGGLGAPSGRAEAIEAGGDSADAVGVPPRLATGGAGAAAWLGGAGVNAGATDSKPKEAGCGTSAAAPHSTGSELVFAGVVFGVGPRLQGAGLQKVIRSAVQSRRAGAG